MRELKFRFLKDKCWYYIDLTNTQGFAKELLENIKDGGLVFNVDTPPQQYAGLKDKNGKEIYEGDIVIGSNPKWSLNGFRDYEKVEVEFVNGGFYPFADNEDNMPYPKSEKDCEVIGNIYDSLNHNGGLQEHEKAG